MKFEYKCFLCNEAHIDKAQFTHDCPDDAVIEVPVQVKSPIFSNLDWGAGLAIGGAIAMNVIFLNHTNYSFAESVIHSLGFGFFIGRIVRNEK